MVGEPPPSVVSVIIPTYRRTELAQRAVASVLAQSYRGLECIVVDDHSRDGTDAVLWKRFGHDERFTVVTHLENRHVSAARNTGLEAANGDLIAFLDDDDVWLPEKLARQVTLLENSGERVGFCYCWFDVYRGDERQGGRHPQLRGDVFEELLVGQPLGNASTLLVRSQAISRTGGFDEALPRGNDGDFMRRLARDHEAEVVPEVLVHYFVEHEGHPRITAVDRSGLQKSIEGHRVKLRKFRDEFLERPSAHARVLLLIASDFARLADASQVATHCWKALVRAPLSTTIWSGVIRVSARYVRNLLFRRAAP